MALVRITFDGKGGAQAVDRWNIGFRVRDVEVAPDGALWMIEDARPGRLVRATPIGMAVSAPSPQPATPAPTASTSPNASSPDHIKSVIADNNCLVCHRIGKEGGDIAPSLNGVGTHRTEAQIRAAILTPPAKTKAGAPNPMPSYAGKLTAQDLKNLTHYLSTLPATP